jgi:cytochrome P450
MQLQDPTLIDDVTLEELEIDPYPHYARWRREQPVARLQGFEGDAWVVSRWDDCEAVAKDESKLDSHNENGVDYFGPNILNLEGTAHAWLRAGVDPPLRPRAVQGYIEGLARPVSREYVARLRDRGRCEATGELLELISVRVIADVLGLTDVDDATLQRWFLDLSAGLTGRQRDAQIAANAARAMEEIDAHTIDAIARLTAEPDDSGLSHMIHTGTETPRTYEDLIGTFRVIILGGFQEPGHGAAASLYGVLGEPQQHADLMADPATFIPHAIHEGLRWISPFGLIQRRAVVDIDVNGVVIPAGDEINIMVASANHDETRYENAEKFDLHRPRQTHASFGYGAHFCSGHFISRQLERIMLEEVFEQLPNLRLDPDEPATVKGFLVRGVKRLPVVWDV